MGEWRRREQQGCDQKERWWPTRKDCGRPPLSPGFCQPVPYWEKKFCTSVCSVPWTKLCETKKLMYMYPKVVEWNDSEGEEAFHNAKARYWAEINHLHCPIPLPDPNMYIDIVDHNAFLDLELVEDLYKQPPPSQDGEEDNSIVWDSFQFTTETVPVTGWGDEEGQVPTIYTTDQSIQIQPTGWGDAEDPSNDLTDKDLFSMSNPETQDIFGISHCGRDNSWEHQSYRNNEYHRKGHGGSRIGSSYTNVSYQAEGFHTNNCWRNKKKENCNNEQTVHYKSQWNSMHSCSPENNQGSTDSHGPWQWHKFVS